MAKSNNQVSQPDLGRLAGLVRSGRPKEAIEVAEQQMQRFPDDPGLIQFLSGIYYTSGRLADARTLMRRYLELDPGNVQCLQGLATVEQKLKKLELTIKAQLDAIEADPGNAFSFLRLAGSYMSVGDREKAITATFLAYDRHVKIFNMADDPQVAANLKKLAADGEVLLREKLAEIQDQALRGVKEAHPGADLSRIEGLVWRDVFADKVAFQHDQQRPQWLYLPGLEPRALFERSEFSWVKGLEAAFPDIRTEALEVLDPDKDTVPYIDTGQEVQEGWKKLDGSRQWGVAHLFKEGQRNPQAYKKFPATAAALDAILKSQKSETFMEAFFSVLKPGAEIPPHFGQTNASLTVHFPLVIPERVGIRVANHRHTWRPGETFIFDDSFEHKAWNRSDQIRIVLILGDWHPGLSAIERAALDVCVPARLDWMGGITLEKLLGS